MTTDTMPAGIDAETQARMVALIIGPNSAAAQALALLEQRRAAGESVAIFAQGKSWFVGHAIRSEAAKLKG